MADAQAAAPPALRYVPSLPAASGVFRPLPSDPVGGAAQSESEIPRPPDQTGPQRLRHHPFRQNLPPSRLNLATSPSNPLPRSPHCRTPSCLAPHQSSLLSTFNTLRSSPASLPSNFTCSFDTSRERPISTPLFTINSTLTPTTQPYHHDFRSELAPPQMQLLRVIQPAVFPAAVSFPLPRGLCPSLAPARVAPLVSRTPSDHGWPSIR